MSKKKAGGSTQLGRDSISKRLGVKIHAGQVAEPGKIIVRQRGSKFAPGDNTKLGNDDTIYSLAQGVVEFQKKKKRGFDGKLKTKTFVHVK